MVDGQTDHKFNKTAEKWLDLAQRRRAHFIDLYRNGLWRRFYSEPQFLLRLRELTVIVDLWTGVVAACKGETATAPADSETPTQRTAA